MNVGTLFNVLTKEKETICHNPSWITESQSTIEMELTVWLLVSWESVSVYRVAFYFAL